MNDRNVSKPKLCWAVASIWSNSEKKYLASTDRSVTGEKEGGAECWCRLEWAHGYVSCSQAQHKTNHCRLLDPNKNLSPTIYQKCCESCSQELGRGSVSVDFGVRRDQWDSNPQYLQYLCRITVSTQISVWLLRISAEHKRVWEWVGFPSSSDWSYREV